MLLSWSLIKKRFWLILSTKNGINEVMNFFEDLGKAGFKAEVMILAANDNYVIGAHRGWSNVTNHENVDLNCCIRLKIIKLKE